MNEMRKLIETIEQINEVSDFDGDSLDKLIAQFEDTCEVLGIESDEVKKKELTQVVLSRAEPIFDPIADKNWRDRYGNDDERTSDKYDIDPEYDDWTDHMKQMGRRGR